MKQFWINNVFMLVALPTLAASGDDYLRDVKPLLAEHCYRCHGASQQKGDMRIDTASSALKGGESGAGFKPGKSADSLIIQAITGQHDTISRMPYKKPPLTDAQIATIAHWIDSGGTAPADEEPEKALHWSFVAPIRPEIPKLDESVISKPVNSSGKVSTDSLNTGSLITSSPNPIDAFILSRLAKDKIKPSPETDKITLIRRLSLDLTGLPPGIEEVDAFANDKSLNAYEKLVDRFLASPHYGERWGRHWLDVARYADSNGYSVDAPRSIWKYRDWVIAALNRDMPFDQFATWQVAGDLIDTNSLAPHTSILEPLIATGFSRNTQINQEGGIDPEQFRVESVMDRVNTTATGFLGITLACAQCHDHKFDPFTQKDYYQFYAFFNSTIGDGHGKGSPDGMLEIPGEDEATESRQKEMEEAEEDLDRYLNTKGSELVKWEQALSEDEKSKFRPDVKRALNVAFADRNMKQKRAVYAAFHPDDDDFKQRSSKLTRMERNQPKPVTTLVMRELDKPRETHVFTKGDFTRPAAVVQPGVPAIFNALNAGQASSQSRTTGAESERDRGADSGASPANGKGKTPALLTRLDLASWLIDTNNPLTARVTVNRIWQQYFGRGLVETENDFGTQGSLPSHPELLDWLACELMAPHSLNVERSAPWSLKHIHRLIVNSATYRQSSKARPDLAITDPNNKLLARQSRVRLDAEIVRDVCLTASGLMNDKIGGPGVFPPQPDGVMNLGQSRREWKPSIGPDRYRRGMYTFFWRATPHPALMVFDSADGFSTCTRRARSNTPLQALTLLNDEAFHEFAQSLATRILKEDSQTDSARIDHAFRLCLSRPPSQSESQRLLDLLNKELLREGDAQEKEAWNSVARVLLNLDETITRE